MTTGNMPNPPDQPTMQVVPSELSADPEATEATGQPAAPLSLPADMARIIEEQVEVIAQKQLYHSQLMLGVSALGTDIVNAKQSALLVAQALRNSEQRTATNTLVSLGDAQVSQVNDRTLPYRFNSQVSGLLQGIILDAITQAYQSEPDKLAQARIMLSRIFNAANDEVMRLPKEPPRFQAPAFSPEPLRLGASGGPEQTE